MPFLPRFFSSRRSNTVTPRSSVQSDRLSTYTSDVIPAPPCDSTRRPVGVSGDGLRTTAVVSPPASVTTLGESSFGDTISVAETPVEAKRSKIPRYGECWFLRASPLSYPSTYKVYYRIYTEYGALISSTSTTPDDPFLGCVKTTSVPPPHIVASFILFLLKLEAIKQFEPAKLFLTLSSTSPMSNASEIAIFNPIGPGFLPQEPLALVVNSAPFESIEQCRRMIKQANTLAPSPNTKYRLSNLLITFVTSRLSDLAVSLSLLSAVWYQERSTIESTDQLASTISWPYSRGFCRATTHTHVCQTTYLNGRKQPSIPVW
jgi:hypothetical protein